MSILVWLGGFFVFAYLLNGLILALRINAVEDKPLSRFEYALWVIAWPAMLWLKSKR